MKGESVKMETVSLAWCEYRECEKGRRREGKSRRQHGVMAILLAMALLASLFGAAPAAGQVHLYNPEVWPGSGIVGEEIFGISVDYEGIPPENFYDETFNDEHTDLAVQLTNHPASDTIPCWSPCNTISFASNRIAWDLDIVDAKGWRHSDIWVMDPDGTGKSFVTYNDARDGYDISWSPNCVDIVFCRTDASYTSPNDDICIVDKLVGETSVTFIYTAGDTQCPDWSPDGSEIAITGSPTLGGWEIGVIDPTSGGDKRQVTDFPTYDCQWPDWSPDGTKIAFEYFTTPTHQIWEVTSSAQMATPASIETKMLTNDGILPAWSPDGSKIAFCRETAGNWDIWVMNAGGTGQTRLTKDPAKDLHPTWSPDGSKIAFQSDRSGNWDIWVIPVEPNDMHPRLAVDNDGDVHKVWMREVDTNHWEAWYAELTGSGPGFKVSPKQISDVDTANSVYPSIALDINDDAHVVWVDYRVCGCPEIYYSKVRDNSGTDLTFPDAPISDLDGIPSGRAVGFPPWPLDELTPVDDHTATYIEHPDIDVGPSNNVHIVWSDARDSEGTLYAGTTDPGKVYEYKGLKTWWQVPLGGSPLGYSVLCLAVYKGKLYAGTMSDPTISLSVGKVWRYDESASTWTQVGSNLDNMVNVLVVYKGDLYAGTSMANAKLYKLIGSTWNPVVNYAGWPGIRSGHVWKNWLYLGDHGLDKISRFDGANFEPDVLDYGGSCIWDFACYLDSLYAGAYYYYNNIFSSPNGISWSVLRDNMKRNVWEMQAFDGYLYYGTDWVGTGPQEAQLWHYDGNIHTLVWNPSVSQYYEGIISMVTNGDMLYIGTGKEVTYWQGGTGTGMVYAYSTGTPFLISNPSANDLGIGVQSLLWKPDYPLVWEVYYQEQNTDPRPDNPANVIIDDLLISADDGKSSMAPVVAAGSVGWPGPAVHIAWQDERDGQWEVYYQQQQMNGNVNVNDNLVSHTTSSDGFNSASPDIGVDDAYIHITWMDQRDSWWQDTVPCTDGSCNVVVPHIWDFTLNQFYWEIYKVMLYPNGNFFAEQGNPIKRQSDMSGCRGCGKYDGPPDGYSMYPRIAVEPGDPGSNHALCTHITWHDDRWGINNWEIYCIALQSYCENPGKVDRVTTHPLLDMYPDVALDPTVSPQRAHLKWQTDRAGFWRIYETRRIHKGDSDAEYIIAELFRDEALENISTFYLGQLYPYQNITANDSIAYGFSFGLTQPGHYQFRVRARDSAGYEATTDWIEGPVVVPLEVPPEFIVARINNSIYYFPYDETTNVFGSPVLIDTLGPCTGSPKIDGRAVDFDNDGDYDVLIDTSTWYADKMKLIVYENTCTTFVPAWQVTQPGLGAAWGDNSFVVAGDFDEDGDWDFIQSVIDEIDPYTYDIEFFAWSNDKMPGSTLTFNPLLGFSINTSPIAHPYDMESADFNNDGHLDLLIGDYPHGGVHVGKAYLYTGNGRWRFVTPVSPCIEVNTPHPQPVPAMVSGDFYRGLLPVAVDVIVGLDDDGDPGQTSFFSNDGTGVFSQVAMFPPNPWTPHEPFDLNKADEYPSYDRPGGDCMDAKDFNKDGVLDIVASGGKVLGISPSNGLWYLKGLGSGTFDHLFLIHSNAYLIAAPERLFKYVINETEYKNSITQPIDVSKIHYKFIAVDEEWAAKWTTVLLYGQKETKYSIEIFLNKTGYVTRVDFERWGFPITEIPYDLAEQSLASLPPGFAIDP